MQVTPNLSSIAQMNGFTDFSDRYEIIRKVGSGGMARVLPAHDAKHDRKVARGLDLPAT